MSRVPLGGSGYLVPFLRTHFTLAPQQGFHIDVFFLLSSRVRRLLVVDAGA